MKTPPEFFEWLDGEIVRRGFRSARDFARHAGISHSGLSKARSGAQSLGLEVCVSIARALEVPETAVLTRAGLIPAEPERTPSIQELMGLFNQLSDEEQETELEALRLRVQRLKASKGGKGSKRATSHT